VTGPTIETDVLVVGAGPAGAAAAYHLARHGIDVTVVDRSSFPREKVCGDGLTPRSVGAMLRMGVDPDDPGFRRVNGLRVHAGDRTFELPWPELDTWPDYGLVRTRYDFDQLLIERAQKAGASVRQGTEAVEPIMDGDWVRGASTRSSDDREAPLVRVISRFTVGADGAASRLASAVGVRRLGSRPLGIAARRYYRTGYDPGPWFESWLDLWDGDMLLPGYGWLFPLPEGRINLGAGLLNTFKNFSNVSARRLFDAFLRMLPDWMELSDSAAEGPVRSGPLPMSFNRAPQAVPGLVIVGDAAGSINPFNGEGIAYAIETGELAAELIFESLVNNRPGLALQYPAVLRERYEPYYRMGRVFARAIGRPAVMGRATKYLLPNRKVMAFALRMMANLSDGRAGDAQDRLLYALERLAKAA
jgi:geranylgeranyl reductase family protein